MPVVSRPSLLLPAVPDLTRWAVIACDQFTGVPAYWHELASFIGDAPSTLNFVLPEAFLESEIDSAPARISAAMEAALRDGTFREASGFVLVERTLASGARRLGLIADIALADYEYTDISSALIKATEQTVADRLPPRVAVRAAAPLEAPHAIVLLDDPAFSVIERLYSQRDSFDLVYDFDLNMGGGHIRGWLIPDDDGAVLAGMLDLVDDGLFAVVGDGNHSIAAAKLAGDTKALVELVNIHDASIEFEPIHRVVFGAGAGFVVSFAAAMDGAAGSSAAKVRVVLDDDIVMVPVAANAADAIADIQSFIDSYLAANPGASVDYIHGLNEAVAIAQSAEQARIGAVVVEMPTIAKNGLFNYARRRGVLPRKSFSIGHATDKRYYLEMAHRG